MTDLRGEKGREAEDCVRFHFESEERARIVGSRMKTPYAEIDLIVESTDGSLYLIEVKRFAHAHMAFQSPLSVKQKLRLLKARTWLESKTKREVRVVLAVIDTLNPKRLIKFAIES